MREIRCYRPPVVGDLVEFVYGHQATNPTYWGSRWRVTGVGSDYVEAEYLSGHLRERRFPLEIDMVNIVRLRRLAVIRQMEDAE